MNTQKIQQTEINNNMVASLPNRPNAKKELGGGGLTPQETKAAFDKLPLLAITRLNSLIDDIEREDGGRIGESIKTGLSSKHTLDGFFRDVKNGTLASYLVVGDSTLVEKIAALQSEIDAIKERLEMA